MSDDFEVVELEYSDEDILYYLVDEDDNEVGFVIDENGHEVECYYEGFDEQDYELEDRPPEPPESAADDAGEPSYFEKIAAIAGHEGNKARKAAGEKLDKAREAAAPHVEKAKSTASDAVGAVKEKVGGEEGEITREGVKETTADLNAIAKEGAETAKELKEAYDDIMDSVGWMLPKGARRRLP